MCFLNLCQDFEVSGQEQRVRDARFLVRYNGLEMVAFRIRQRISPTLSQNRSGPSSTGPARDHPSRTSIMSLCCFTQYPGYCCLSFHFRGPYFFAFLRPIVLPWITHFDPNVLLLLVIYKFCVHSVLRPVLMFS